MTREDREHGSPMRVAYLDALQRSIGLEVGDLPLGVLGFSQGVTTVARWIPMGHVRPHRLVLWGGLPPELTKQQLANALGITQVDFGTR
ncbi:MAG: hypothetical protein IPH63_17645 [Flavobacteriales bacterium]|nr:hypothetical protein [Flavobacteriales bacterium]